MANAFVPPTAVHEVTGLTPNIIEERPMNIAVMDVYPSHDGSYHLFGIPHYG
jgi:hypothetical protein